MESRAINRERFCAADPLSSSFVRTPLILLAVGATLFLTGCGPKRVRVDFTGYENSYAVTSNREELLNLARLQQHDPTYFFKLGQISSSYRMQATLTGAGNYTPQGMTPGGAIPTGGGAPGLVYENDPSFTFIPVNDDTNASILLKPIDSTVFYSLYVQGWRLDQLLRLAVNRVELTLPVSLDSLPTTDPKHKTGCRVEVIRNMPPSWFNATDNYANDGPALASYVTFLRVSAVIYALQKHGLLLLRGSNTFEPIDQSSFIPNRPDVGDASAKNSPIPAAKDINDAAAKNEAWELQGADSNGDGGKWVLGTNSLEPQFQLTAHPEEESAAGYVPEDPKNYGRNVEVIRELLEKDFDEPGNGMTELKNGPDLTEILEMLYNGFSIEESSTDQDSEKKLCQGKQSNRISAHLVMRSLIGLMAAAAQEQQSFDVMMDPQKSHVVPAESGPTIMEFYSAVHLATTGNPPFPDEMAAKMATLAPLANAPLSAVIPKIEQLPVLKMTWGDAKPPDVNHLAQIGLALKYRDQDYIISDSQKGDAGVDVPGNTYWNRDMFRLISELSSQVSVDISKFPLPEVLQLRTE